MKLVGMLDSPYVRRTAISLQLLGLRFEHQPLSVFRTFDEFSAINPVVKAPTLVCDDGQVLMDSSLIIQYAEALARPRSLFPAEPRALQHELRMLGLALAAIEKGVQLIYENTLRPPAARHLPWSTRVSGQLRCACDELECELAARQWPVGRASISQAGITAAVGWRFLREMLPQRMPVDRFPALEQFSLAAEALPEFQATPHGDGTIRA